MAIGGLVGGANIGDIFGQRQADEIGSVNKKPIFFKDFNSFVSSEINRSTNNNPSLMADEQKEFARAIVWERLINDLLIEEQIEKKAITVSDEEVLFQLQNNPPFFLQSNDLFQTNGEFDLEKYLEFILSPSQIDWRPIEQFMQNVYLPNYKLRQFIINGVSITQDDILNDFKKRFVDYEIETLHVTEKAIDNDFLSDRPTEQELLNFYNSNLSKYEKPETRFLKFVKWPISTNSSDSLRTKIEAEDLIFRLKDGEDFATLANQYTEDPSNFRDPSNPRGGSLGWFSPGQMLPAFSDAAFSANVGDIVGPVITQYGYHIIKINRIKKNNEKNQVNASHILLSVKAGKDTKDNLNNISSLFSLEASENGFTKQAELNNLEIFETSGLVKESIFIDDLGPVRAAVNFAFKNNPGSISDSFQNDDYFFVFQMDSIVEESFQTFEEVKDQIKNKLRLDLIKSEIKKIANQIDINDDSNFKSIANENPTFEYIEKSKSKLNGSFLSVGKSNYLIGALSNSYVGQVIGPIPTVRGQAFVRVLNIDEINQANYDQMKESIKFSLLINRQNISWDDWILSLRDNAKIKDYRYDFY
tara:strand:- start:162 stop:1922 length:1761 start_codon:yes stop_codon:yes gene_type:complete